MLHVDMRDGLGAVDFAHGTALTGGDDARRECDQLLDQATGLVDRIDDPYPWESVCESEHYLDVQRATCYLRLGLAHEALTLWDPLMESMAGSAWRDLGVFRARQAQALAVCGEPEQAVEIAGEVAVIARDTGSVRMHRELADLQARMAPWAQDRVGRELRETLNDHGFAHTAQCRAGERPVGGYRMVGRQRADQPVIRGRLRHRDPHRGRGRCRGDRVRAPSDIDIRWDVLRFAMTTHTADDVVTELDFQLAERINAIAASHGVGGAV
jgi:hypothetical protein